MKTGATADAADAQQLRDLDGVVDLIHQLLLNAGSVAEPFCLTFMARLDLPLAAAAALWETRQTIALRALFLLEFLQARLAPGAPNTDVLARMPDGRHSATFVLIFRTLLQCLAGEEQPLCLHACMSIMPCAASDQYCNQLHCAAFAEHFCIRSCGM